MNKVKNVSILVPVFLIIVKKETHKNMKTLIIYNIFKY